MASERLSRTPCSRIKWLDLTDPVSKQWKLEARWRREARREGDICSVSERLVACLYAILPHKIYTHSSLEEKKEGYRGSEAQNVAHGR